MAALALCFGLSALAGPIAASGRVQYLPIVLLGLVLIALALYRLEWGILILFLSTLVLRISIPTGTGTPLVASLLLTALLTGVWLAQMILEGKRLYCLPSPVNAPLLGFAIVCVLSLIWSDLWRDPLVYLWDYSSFIWVRAGALAAMLLSPAALLLVANRFRDERWLKVTVGIFFAAGTVGIITTTTRLSLPLLNLRGLFPMWVVSLALSQALFNRELKDRYRWAMGLLAVAWFANSFGRDIIWLSGWFPAFVAIVVVTFLRSRQLFLLLIAVGVLFTIIRWDYLHDAVVVQSQREGDFGRLDAWAVNWRVTKDHLFLGTGPAGYAAYYMSLFPQEAISTHSNYVDILAQTGLVGTAFFIWFLVAMGVTARQAWRRVPQGSFPQALAVGCIGGYVGTLVAMGLGDWFLPFVYNQTIAGYDYTVWGWLFMGVLVGLSHYSGGEKAAGNGYNLFQT
ncbi:MAG: hypothetical protein C4309_02305 [Chloroflexota bacterium]